MSLKYSLHSFILLFLLAALFGCKQSTAPSTKTTDSTTVTHKSGEFGWVNGSSSIDRKDYSYATSSASAAYTNFGPNSTHQLDITLTVYIGAKGIENTVELVMPMLTPKLGKISVGASTDLTNGSITMKIDTAHYRSIAGGTIEITKFDTLNSTVSGTFSFDAKDGNNQVHVTSGFFTDIPIYYGAFHPGLVTATVNGVPFTSQFAQVAPSFWTVDSAYTMVMSIDGDNNGDVIKSIAFGIEMPMAGYYYDLNGDARWYGSFVQSGTPVISINSMSGAVGRLTITNFDWVTHRISGTFYLAGYDKNGDYIDVENGEIDNVQWFML